MKTYTEPFCLHTHVSPDVTPYQGGECERSPEGCEETVTYVEPDGLSDIVVGWTDGTES